VEHDDLGAPPSDRPARLTGRITRADADLDATRRTMTAGQRRRPAVATAHH
jgi:hypothetical protein